MNPEPSLVPSRAAMYAPLTERDERVLDTADWLEEQGYTPAATVLKTMVGRHQMVAMEEVRDKKHTAVLPTNEASYRLAMETAYCRIWSGEYRSYWRAEGAGYTWSALNAGTFTVAEAYELTKHCGPEKGICFEVLPYANPVPSRQSGWKS